MYNHTDFKNFEESIAYFPSSVPNIFFFLIRLISYVYDASPNYFVRFPKNCFCNLTRPLSGLKTRQYIATRAQRSNVSSVRARIDISFRSAHVFVHAHTKIYFCLLLLVCVCISMSSHVDILFSSYHSLCTSLTQSLLIHGRRFYSPAGRPSSSSSSSSSVA